MDSQILSDSLEAARLRICVWPGVDRGWRVCTKPGFDPSCERDFSRVNNTCVYKSSKGFLSYPSVIFQKETDE